MELNDFLIEQLRSTPNPNFAKIGRLAKETFDLEDSKEALRLRTSKLYKKFIQKSEPSSHFLMEETLKKLGINPENIVEAKFINHLKTPSVNIKTKYSKEEVTIDNLLEKIQDIIDKSFVNPIILPESKPIKEEKAFMFWSSDKHVGAKTEKDSIYENEYNRVVFKHRMEKSLSPLIEAANYFGRFDKVVYADLGDSLDGWDGYTTRGGHKLPQNMNNVEAFSTYIEESLSFFDKLINLNLANSYEFIAQVNDNHSGNFGQIANETLARILNLKYPQVKTTIFSKFVDHFEYGAHTFMLCHGKDSEDLKHGLPFIPNDKVSDWIREYISEKNINTEFKHFIKGDLHQSNSFTMKWGKYKNVLSLYGSSKYIHNNFGNTKGGLCYDIVWKHNKKCLSDEIMF